MIKRIIIIFISLLILFCSTSLNCFAISAEDSNKMANYITIIGRAIGCGMHTDTELIRVINWLKPKFSDSQEESMYTMIIAEFLEKMHENKVRDYHLIRAMKLGDNIIL